jgi:hypothetical protein
MCGMSIQFPQYNIYITCCLSKVWFVHSNSSLEFSAGIGVLSNQMFVSLCLLHKVFCAVCVHNSL